MTTAAPLTVSHLSASVGTQEVLHDVLLSVAPGEIVFLLGANGSGKSTLLKALAGHPSVQITHGAITLGAEEITNALPEVRARAGLFLSLQQVPEIEGVALGSFLHRALRALRGEDGVPPLSTFLKEAGDRARAIGIDPGFLRRGLGIGLSGGEKKQAEALQMVLLAPAVALLDEIDSGADVDAVKKIATAIRFAQTQGTGFLIVTHYRGALDGIVPDRVLVLRDGRIEEEGGADLADRTLSLGFDTVSPRA